MKTLNTLKAIPQFGLYGESIHDQDPGFIHIEDIAKRSSKSGWLIKPHRHGKLFQILCMFDGRLAVQLDEENLSLSGSWAITIPQGVVHGFRFSPDTKGVVLTVADPLLVDDSYHKAQHYFEELTTVPCAIKFGPSDELLDRLIQYLGLIRGEFQGADTGHSLMLEWLVRMVLMTLRRQLSQSRLQESTNRRSSHLLASFRKLLEENYRAQWKVEQYAAAMRISVSSLNRRCNESLGASAKVIIQDRVLIEAKRRLIYTRESIEQVAYTLGFKDPAYFSRYFKNLEGTPPGTYRKTRNNETYSSQHATT